MSTKVWRGRYWAALALAAVWAVFRVWAARPGARSMAGAGSNTGIRSMDFEVYGRVQGVFFRKYTKEQAVHLGLKGWCKNTRKGTVQGTIQGPSDNIVAMKEWLTTKGSPSSQIEKAEFRNDNVIPEYTYSNFDIVRD